MRCATGVLVLLLWLGGPWSLHRGSAQEDPSHRSTDVVESNPARRDQKLARFFATEIEPLLAKHCRKCHGGDRTPKGGLSLLHREDLLRGGESGPAVSLDDPAASLLLEAVRYESFEMPPDGPLPQEAVAKLERWVRLGLPWTPGKERSSRRPAHSTIADRMARATRHWAFQPIRATRPPSVDGPPPSSLPNRSFHPIDAFIARKQKELGVQPVGPADKTVLLRRAYYDLIGLPPTPAEVRAFLEDDSPLAFERVVDRLLASPQYGVRWGRHWLDLVRYAETNSYERDADKPFVWRYRDYVIESFNADKPYDQFIREQLAGDEYLPVTRPARVATGFYRLGIWDDEPVDRQQALYDDLDDIVTTVSQTFLGINIGCARCHDHKIDPVPQADYYRFLAFFNGITRYGVRDRASVARNSLRPLAGDAEVASHNRQVADYRRRLRKISERLAAIEAPVKADFAPVEHEEFKHRQHRLALLKKRVPRLLSPQRFAEYERLCRDREQLERHPPKALEQALCVTEIGSQPRETFVLIRGNVHAKGKRVEPGFPAMLGNDAVGEIPPARHSSGRRRALAEWIASPQNPLTARVIVNRLWHYHFGRGIVATPSDFGFGGADPTHPELLDYLAAELIRGGWRLKRLHRMIMLSAAYQRASVGNRQAEQVDPGNRTWWRFLPRRLDAESIRDSLLAVTGELNLELSGPSIYVPIPKEVLAGQSRPGSGWGTSPPGQAARRSIFIHLKRSLVPPMLATFDGADTDASCPRRYVSTQPTQALLMLNSRFAQDRSRAFAESLRREAGADVRRQVRLGLWRVLQRPPRTDEVVRGTNLIERLVARHGVSPDKALEYYCLVLLNLNELFYLD